MSVQGIRSKKLGQYLVEHSWITGEQLIRAIQSQRLVGGRIGTCLLEMDVLTEDCLLTALSEQLEVPSVRIEQLRGIGRSVLDKVPPKVALRCQAIPFAVDDIDVHVATLNVDNLAYMDELAFCTNRRVRPHIANEVRIFEALERYYGFECPQRYGHLLDRLNRAKYMWDESAKVLLGAGEEEIRVIWKDPEEALGQSKILHSAASHSNRKTSRGDFYGLPQPSRPQPTSPRSTATALQLSQDQRHRLRGEIELSAAPPSAPGANGAAASHPAVATLEQPAVATAGKTASEAPPSSTLSLAEVDRLLAAEVSYQAIGNVLARFLAGHFARSLVFQVRGGEMLGWLGHAPDLDRRYLTTLRLDLQQPSALATLARGAERYVGPLAPMPVHRQLARSWGGELPRQAALIPIRVRERMVCALYGDEGKDSLDPEKLDLLARLAQKAAMAFEVCILRKKIRQA